MLQPVPTSRPQVDCLAWIATLIPKEGQLNEHATCDLGLLEAWTLQLRISTLG